MRLKVTHKLKILVYKCAFTPSVQVGWICLKSLCIYTSNGFPPHPQSHKNAIHKAPKQSQ